MKTVLSNLYYFRSVIIIILVFALVSSAGLSEEDSNDPSFLPQHVLVINSYHYGSGWSDDQSQAITDYFTLHRSNTVVSAEFLDWKRFPYEENLQRHSDFIRYKYLNMPVDLVIATDDVGLKFAIDHRDEIFPGKPIVFTGVTRESAKQLLAGVSNITGVYEKEDVIGTLECIERLHPDLRHIYIVADNTVSGSQIRDEIVNTIDTYSPDNGNVVRYTYDVLDKYTYEEIFQELSMPVKDSVVLMGSFARDISGTAIPSAIFIDSLTEAIEIPVYSLYELHFGYGIVGGSMLSATVHGEAGAILAIRILQGEAADSIPADEWQSERYGFDYLQMRRFDLDSSKLPENSVIINKPMSIFEQYTEVMIFVIVTICLLTVFIIILSINISRKKRVQAALVLEHNELLETYEELAASEEELKYQNFELIEKQERINYLAYYDCLTGLPNRENIMLKSDALIGDVSGKGMKMLLLLIDLDNFNYVNTTHGHEIGDKLLRRLAERLESRIGKDVVIGRVGGDEFVILRPMDDDFEISDYIDIIMKSFSSNIHVEELEIYVSASMGYAVYPDDGYNYDELLIRADIALSKMKEKGKARASRFDVDMNNEMVSKINITNALRNALTNDELYVVFQPQYDVKRKKIVGFETLVRWKSEALGFVGPDVFIPVAESTGLITDIGYFIAREAADFAAAIKGQGYEMKVAINVSVIQLVLEDFEERFMSILNEKNVKPQQVELEITESVLIESFELINQKLTTIRSMGIEISLDDFGTGYSSLTYLKKLPISTLKIDKSFIDDILTEDKEHFFTGAIIDIAKDFGFKVIAEGVEGDRQIEYLQSYDCHIIQGYWFSKPLEREAAIALLKKLE